jgi:hypothetical protein
VSDLPFNPAGTKPAPASARKEQTRSSCFDDGFRACEQIYVSSSILDQPASYHRMGSYGSLGYVYHEDGSFSLKEREEPNENYYLDKGSDWSGSCKRDAMSDVMECQLTNMDNRLFISFTGSEPRRIGVIGHDFPGRTGAIRVDRKPARSTDTDGFVPATQLLPELLKGQSVTVRYYKWPYDYAKDEAHPIGPLRDALDLLRWMYANSDSLKSKFAQKDAAIRGS